MSVVVFTAHARLRLEERKISEQEVKDTLNNPKWRFYDLKDGHQIAIGARRKKGHYLIVVYDQSEDVIEVITVIDVSRSLDKIISRRVESRRWVEL
ncbi:DUF4258 domain-containing protein [Thermococcus barophilus]|uniref:DUF4258 domain-containing protein n=1 Tax=Thermococcus barophilus TaxID=55802 RepID=A0A0S1XAN4_THEBA|nr:DUF4258 domain-containing protein [Thermococcus barophilus]ALM74851.1 hypothetical protein TBCH5v1_0899 [Thermococcus barophilus]